MNEINISFLESRISKLTHLIENMVAENALQERVYGICVYTGHPTYLCPILQADDPQHVMLWEDSRISSRRGINCTQIHTIPDGETT